MNNENNNAVLDEVLSSEESRVNRFLLNYLSNNGALDKIIDVTRAQVTDQLRSVEKELLLLKLENSPEALKFASEDLKNDIKKDKQEYTIRKPICSETDLETMLENLTWFCNLSMKD